LAATRKQLLKVVDKAAKTLLPEMDAEIIALCKRFGVQNLDSVKLDRAAHVNAVKDGEPHAYKDLSRGDRLRMRIATVIALLRIGKARGVTSHPGLLIIDSIAAEELTEAAARSLITELQKITQELPTLQVVFTTAHPEFVDRLLPEDHIITAEGTHLF
jgi:ABC-type ATPase with predicted acetyltransferase domain